ncbi:MAG: LolA family protein [Asticcacaulis sp.]
MNRLFRLFAALFACAAIMSAPAIPAFAGKNNFDTYIVPPNFNAADKARIVKAISALQGMTAAQGRFEQTGDRGRTVEGKWYLQRPGKIRFEYDAPSSLLVVSDGRNVNMWDPRLQSFNAYPLSETPLSLFLDKTIRFDQGVIITEVKSNGDGFTLKARSRNKTVDGSVMLSFAQSGDGPASLRQWTITDAEGRATTVRLLSVTPDSHLPGDLFVLNKPQQKK